jgi:uncharacterized protein YndB with AHSA1/START domain
MEHQIEKHYRIKAPIEKVWQALTDMKRIEAWGGDPKEFDLKVGGKFSLWGGDIYGVNTMVQAPTLLKQDWISGEWTSPSKVVFELTKISDQLTELTLLHDGIPTGEALDFDSGWDDYYIGPLIALVEKQK